MPTARFTLQTRSPESTSTSLPLPIHIRCRHFVNVLSSSDNIVTLRSAPAAGIKVELDGELPVVLSGFVRGVKIEQERLGSSGVARFFESFLRENKVVLGLEHISHVVSDARGVHLSLTPTPLLSPPSTSRQLVPVLTMNKLEIDIIFGSKSKGSASNSADTSGADANAGFEDPFSRNLSDVYEGALGRLLVKFVRTNLVKRYPYVFGGWKHSFELERKLFPSMARSLSNLFSRSENKKFLETGARLFSTLKLIHKEVLKKEWETIRSICTYSATPLISADEIDNITSVSPEDGEEKDTARDPQQEFEEVIVANLGRLYVLRIRPKVVKLSILPAMQEPPTQADAEELFESKTADMPDGMHSETILSPDDMDTDEEANLLFRASAYFSHLSSQEISYPPELLHDGRPMDAGDLSSLLDDLSFGEENQEPSYLYPDTEDVEADFAPEYESIIGQCAADGDDGFDYFFCDDA